MLIVRDFDSGLFQFAFFAALLLNPAGALHWPRAVQFFLIPQVVESLNEIVGS